MDLFTVDTVGEQTLLDKTEYNNSDKLCSFSRISNSYNSDEGEISEKDKNVHEKYCDDDENSEGDYDYGGLLWIFRINIPVVCTNEH